ncbi:MAG: ATP-binding protein [bacterium]
MNKRLLSCLMLVLIMVLIFGAMWLAAHWSDRGLRAGLLQYIWKWDMATKVAPLIGLMIVLLIVVVVAFVTPRRIKAIPKPVLWRLLPPLTVMVIAMMAAAGALLYRQHQQQVVRAIACDIAEVEGNLSLALKQQSTFLTAVLQPVAADAIVQKALRANDADRLLTSERSVFSALHRENNITHFYFLNTNRICILRLHHPELRGDLINRFTTIEAARTGKTAAGVELGLSGNFTLRVVQPVFEDGSLAGYVELGKEIDAVLKELRPRTDIQLSVIIRKQYLNRQAYEDGLRLDGRQSDWDRLPNSVVSYASQGRLPDAFAPLADHVAESAHAHCGTERNIVFAGEEWWVSCIPLQDASGKEVAKLLIMRDITAINASFVRLMIMSVTVSAIMLTLLLGFIYALLSRTDSGICYQQAELRESEFKYRSIVDMTGAGYLILDSQGMVLDANQEYVRLSGHARLQDILGKRVTEWTAEGAKQRNAEAMVLCAKNGFVRNFVTEYMHADGLIKYVLINAAVQGNGESLRIISLCRDITERTHNEAKLQKMQKLQSICMTAGGIAHDFNNIITGLFFRIGFVKETLPVDHPGTPALEEAEQALKRAVALIKKLLVIAKGGDVVKEKIRLGALLEDVVHFDLGGSDVKLLFHQAEELWLVEVDKGQIQQVVSNITINARQAMPEGGCLYVTLENAEIAEGAIFGLCQGKYVKVTLRDQGTGIDPIYMDRIFEPYFTTKPTGNGLGLATAYSIINNHGGQIGVVSELGKGATFTFYLPAFESMV